ncbi:MAG: hypothetical protein ABIH64_00010 [Nanoarchaeota archaeon]
MSNKRTLCSFTPAVCQKCTIFEHLLQRNVMNKIQGKLPPGFGM